MKRNSLEQVDYNHSTFADLIIEGLVGLRAMFDFPIVPIFSHFLRAMSDFFRISVTFCSLSSRFAHFSLLFGLAFGENGWL